MANVLVEESSLENIADAIRSKNGTQTKYKPAQMADAITAISGGGGITPTGTKSITTNGTHDVTNYASAQVNVPNSYASSDEGKVVSNGALTAQTSRTVTQNGTVDTTLNDEVIVNVPSSGITPSGSQTFTENGTYDVTSLAQAVVNVQGSNPSHTVIDALTIPVGTVDGVDYKYCNGFQFMMSGDARKMSVSMKRIDSPNGNNIWIRSIGLNNFINNKTVSSFLGASLLSEDTVDGYDQYVFSVLPTRDTKTLFGQGWGDSTYSRLLAVKYFRVYDGSDNLLNEFIPVIKSGIVCFYDTVSGMYYQNRVTTISANKTVLPIFFEGELTI